MYDRQICLLHLHSDNIYFHLGAYMDIRFNMALKGNFRSSENMGNYSMKVRFFAMLIKIISVCDAWMH